MTMPYSRRSFLETSIVGSAALAAAPHLPRALDTPRAGWVPHPSRFSKGGTSTAAPPKPSFPVADYHVHLSPTLTIEQALGLANERGVQLGILEHPGPGYPINTDADLKQYIERLHAYPVRVGLQPVYPGWSNAFSKSVLDLLDYVLMDALTLPKPDGGWLAIWQIDTMVDDAEEFMTRYMQFIEQVLTTEPIDIFGWPTFLPVPIARQYRELWTPARVDRMVSLCAETSLSCRPGKKLAIEINEVAHVPDETFILQAKHAGLKFTFGTDSRNDHAAHFYYCYRMAQKCGLTEADMFVVKRR